MKRIGALLVTVILLGFSLSLGRAGSTINLVADSYMPYTGDSAKGETGFMVDIAKAIWEKKGHTVVYQTMSWKQSLDDARSGASTAIVGANRDDAPDFLYPQTEEAQAQGAFFALTSGSWKYSGTESLAKICLGIISDYKYNPEIAEYIRKNLGSPKKIRAIESSPDILTKFVEALELNNIQAFVEDRNVVKYFLKTFDRADKIGEAGALSNTTNLYIAVSPRDLDGATLVQELNDGMAELRSSGELQTLLTKYGLTDWTKSAKGGN